MNRKETLQIKRDLKFLVCNFFVKNSLYTSLLLQNYVQLLFLRWIHLKTTSNTTHHSVDMVHPIWNIREKDRDLTCSIWKSGATKTDLRTTICYMYADTQAVADALLRNCNISTIQRLQRHGNATNSMSDCSRVPTQRQNNYRNTGSQLQ